MIKLDIGMLCAAVVLFAAALHPPVQVLKSVL